MQDQLNLQCNSLTNTGNLAQISSLMSKIQQTTSTMNETFQQTIIKHEEQFIKSYKIKIYQLTKLFHQLKKNIEDKFINNAITQQLQTVIKERDYFKYQCLKLNTQYKNVLDDYKNLTEQMLNVTEQMNIYKHLLENQKIKSSEIQKNAQKLKNNFTELASKTIHQASLKDNQKKQLRLSQQQKQQIMKLRRQIKDKSQTIRALKAKIQEYDDFAQNKFNAEQERKQLQEVFKWCVQSWKRQIMSKSRKFSSSKLSNSNFLSNKRSISSLNHCTPEQFSSLQKKQLLQMLFTHPQFLAFIQKLLFDSNFQVKFIEALNLNEQKKQQILVKNRNKLYELMKKKGLVGSIFSKPTKFR